MNTRDGINSSLLLRTVLIATGLLASAIFLALSVASPQAASGQSAECENEEFRTGASADLPDCRAYEQVTPVRKFGNAVWARPPVVTESAGFRVPSWSAPDGNRVLYNQTGVSGGENGLRGYQFPQITERGEDGWESRPAIDGPPGDVALWGTNALARQQIPSADRDALLFNAGMPYSPLQPASGGKKSGGAIDFADRTGKVNWLTEPSWPGADLPPGSIGLEAGKFAPISISEDLSTAYFMTRQTLTPEDGASGRTWDQAWALYKVENGVLSNAGTLPDGTVAPAGSISAGLDPTADLVNTSANSNFSSTLSSVNVVSPDGDRALFLDRGNRSAPSPQLYMHRDGQPSLLISKPPTATEPIAGSTGVVPIWGFSATPQNNKHRDKAGATSIATADRDLEVVIFATRDALLPGNPGDGTRINTYRYDVAANQLEYLAELDRLSETLGHPNTTPREMHGNIYRVSDDASRIFFWTDAGELKLWREGESTLTLASGLETSGDTSTRGARFSDDGRTLYFMSTRAIAGEPDHPAGDGPNQTQVYRFEEGVDAVPQCVSCPPPTADEVGPATFDMFTPIASGFGYMGNDPTGTEETNAVSADGNRVYFTSSSTLDPRDQNAVADVYEWSVNNGLELLSSGSPDSRGEAHLDIDETGENVFFVSEEQLTASDIDDQYDIYTARVGGGFPDPPPFDNESACTTGTCQGPSSEGPQMPTAGSVSFTGNGNPEESRDPKASVTVKRLKPVSGARAKLRIRVPGAGKIRVKGSKIRNAGKKAKSAGNYALKVKLNRKGKKALKRKGKLNAKVRVIYRSAEGEKASKRVRIQFTKPKSKKRNRGSR